MITKKRFEADEQCFGCGYWSICWEHACPCAITTEHKGLDQTIFDSLAADAKEAADLYERDCARFEDDLHFDDDDAYLRDDDLYGIFDDEEEV